MNFMFYQTKRNWSVSLLRNYVLFNEEFTKWRNNSAKNTNKYKNAKVVLEF